MNASELEVDEGFLYDRHRREPEGEQGPLHASDRAHRGDSDNLRQALPSV